MKFKKLVALGLAVAMTVGIVSAAKAEQVDVYDQQKELVKSVVFKIGEPRYFVDNVVPGVPMDVAPIIREDRTFIPVRFLANALGVCNGNIDWCGFERKVTLAEPGFSKVEMNIGSKVVYSGGKAVVGVDVAPVITEGRTMLPARFVAEALGYQVDWCPVNKLVIAWPASAPKPDISAVVEELGEGCKPGCQCEKCKPPVVPPVAGVCPVLGEYEVIDGWKVPKERKLSGGAS